MNCQNCGGYIKRRDTYCPHCGEKLHWPPTESSPNSDDSGLKSHPENYKSKNKPPKNGGKSEYKPLQQRYLRGEYASGEDDFYNQYIEDQYIEGDQHNHQGKREYRDEGRYQGDNNHQDENTSYQETKKNYNVGRNYHQVSGKNNYQGEGNYHEPRKKKYRGYDLSAYYPDEEEVEKPGIGMLPIILILILFLLIGFVIGIIMFTNSTLPSFG
ncbi:MAG TPA: hypothetical protein VMC48_06485 [Methanobacterium sp.]|nr:hypothetical protein [Methanobacterium sp.]